VKRDDGFNSEKRILAKRWARVDSFCLEPVDYFHGFPGRFPQLHLKDLKPGYPPTTGKDFRPGAFTQVGQGAIDWKKIFKAAREGGMKHFYVEQDECDRDSLESAKMSYTYLHNLTV
jgi:sugar phosphate isomerase/epimerase